MKKNKKNFFFGVARIIKNAQTVFMHHHHDWGLVSLFTTILILSLFCSVDTVRKPSTVYSAGDIATQDILSDRDFLVEDALATQHRRDRALSLQPLVMDIDKKALEGFRNESLGLLNTINKQGLNEEGLEKILLAFNQKHVSDISMPTFKVLTTAYVQEYLMDTLIPWMENILSNGVMSDLRQLSNVDNAAIVRDLDSGTEVLRTTAGGLIDQRMLQASLGRKLRIQKALTPRDKIALQEIVPLMVIPTLAVNQEVTNQRNEEMLNAVEPVYYKVQSGEMIVREGDVVTHEQQIKLHMLHKSTPDIVDWHAFFSCFIFGFFLLFGLFITPSGNKGTVLRSIDQHLISLLLVSFGFGAWGIIYLLKGASLQASIGIFSLAFPVAGGTGLAALIFAARRYCTIGLILSFFCTLVFRGNIALFIFYFTSSMVNTWIVLRAQNRQDVVWGSMFLLLWMLCTGFGVALYSHFSLAQSSMFIFAIVCNSVFSLSILFAISPILEMLMGYTTRFRLMELMNLQHPLLQELMMKAPGTYYHSLVVSNLVEAGASAIGANSLLCKVGALYHDIGKLSRPDYFVENQFGGANPHDKLSPAMSALILFSHVKTGSELASEYHLGREITDIIEQHHGTRCATFFYYKAQKLGENPRMEDYSYPGPDPQTKEAAVVMLADAVEASSRTLVDPTPARIHAHVSKIIKDIYDSRELDDSDLTLKDLDKLIESFVRIITGLFHQRIAYPDGKSGDNAENKQPEQAKEPAKGNPLELVNTQKQEKSEPTQELMAEWVVNGKDGKDSQGDVSGQKKGV